MEMLSTGMKQQAVKKKFLTMKPNGRESNLDLSTIADVDIGDNILDTSLEEDLWLDTFPEQGMLGTTEPAMEEEYCFQSIWDINVTVSKDFAPPSEACLLAENTSLEETYSFIKEACEDLDESWGHSSYHAPASVVDGSAAVAQINTITNSDLLRNAQGECDLTGFEQEEYDFDMVIFKEDNAAPVMLGPIPEASTSTFIHHPDHLLRQTDLGAAKKTMTYMKKKVGRPERQTPLKISKVPRAGSVSLAPEELKKLKYRRMRDLNNEASKKCRKRRNQKLSGKEQEYQEEEEKNMRLKDKLQEIESKVEKWRLKSKGIVFGY